MKGVTVFYIMNHFWSCLHFWSVSPFGKLSHFNKYITMQGRREGGAFLCVLQLTSIQYLGLIILKFILAFTKKF